MSLQDFLIATGSGGGLVGLIVALVRSKAVRSYVARLANAIDLSDAVQSLQSVVQAQGESIEWLRSELSIAKDELQDARRQLARTEALAAENATLRARVADLEAHVQRLESELKRRRGGRPKNENPQT